MLVYVCVNTLQCLFHFSIVTSSFNELLDVSARQPKEKVCYILCLSRVNLICVYIYHIHIYVYVDFILISCKYYK